MIRRLAKGTADLAIVALAVVIGVASLVIPKRRGQIAFYPAFAQGSFSGDLAILFERMNREQRDAERRLVWSTRSEAVASDLRTRGWSVHLSKGRPFWTLLRSELVLIDKTDLRIGLGRFRLVQVWHGTGFKRIGLEKGGLTGIRRWGLRMHCRSYRLIAASSQADAARKALCFANSSTRVTGQPRNDALVDGRARSPQLAARLGIATGRQIIAYCPTFRDTGEVVPFSPDCWRALDTLLEQRDAVFLVKRHPRDRALHVPRSLSRVRDVTAEVDDVQQLLALTDLLVSDYSSISTDFALTGKPMIFYLYDEAAYRTQARGFAYDLTRVLPGPFAATASALLDLIAEQDWSTTPEYRARYDQFRRQFHEYVDDRSTERLKAEVEALLAQS